LYLGTRVNQKKGKSQMKTILLFAAVTTVFAGVAVAEGDVAKGESDFKKCKACHSIASADEAIVKGGKVGPNLYGVIGRTAGTEDGFKYSAAMTTAGDDGLVWDTENLVTYVADPNAFIGSVIGDSHAKTKMTFKLKDASDIAAYLASVSPKSAASGG